MNQDSSEQTKGRAGPPGGRRGPETHRHCGKTAEPPAAAGTSQGLTSGRPCTGRLMPRSHPAQGQEEGALTAPTSEAQQVKQPAAQQSGVWTPTSGPPGPGPDSSASLSTPEPASACPPPKPPRGPDADVALCRHMEGPFLTRDPRSTFIFQGNHKLLRPPGERQGVGGGGGSKPSLCPLVSHSFPPHSHTPTHRTGEDTLLSRRATMDIPELEPMMQPTAGRSVFLRNFCDSNFLSFHFPVIFCVWGSQRPSRSQ